MALADSIVSISEIKASLRITSPAVTARLTLDREAAISLAGTLLNRNLLDKTIDVIVEFPRRDSSVIDFSVSDFKTMSVLGYFLEDDGNLQVIDDSDIGGTRFYKKEERVLIFPPASGWPAASCGRDGKVTVTVGIASDDIEPAWKKAIILMTGDYYDGNNSENLPHYSAAKSLLRPSMPISPKGWKQNLKRAKAENRRERDYYDF